MSLSPIDRMLVALAPIVASMIALHPGWSALNTYLREPDTANEREARVKAMFTLVMLICAADREWLSLLLKGTKQLRHTLHLPADDGPTATPPALH